MIVSNMPKASREYKQFNCTSFQHSGETDEKLFSFFASDLMNLTQLYTHFLLNNEVLWVHMSHCFRICCSQNIGNHMVLREMLSKVVLKCTFFLSIRSRRKMLSYFQRLYQLYSALRFEEVTYAETNSVCSRWCLLKIT